MFPVHSPPTRADRSARSGRVPNTFPTTRSLRSFSSPAAPPMSPWGLCLLAVPSPSLPPGQPGCVAPSKDSCLRRLPPGVPVCFKTRLRSLLSSTETRIPPERSADESRSTVGMLWSGCPDLHKPHLTKQARARPVTQGHGGAPTSEEVFASSLARRNHPHDPCRPPGFPFARDPQGIGAFGYRLLRSPLPANVLGVPSARSSTSRPCSADESRGLDRLLPADRTSLLPWVYFPLQGLRAAHGSNSRWA